MLRRLIARVESGIVRSAGPPPRRQVRIEDAVSGRFLDTPHGPLFATWTETPLSARRGRFGGALSALDSPISPTMGRVAKTPGLEGVRPSQLLCLDTETTGLATTAGTFAFLVGIGYVEGPLFVVEQFFARDYDEEPALLWTLSERFRRFEGMVTYNGRAFDIPLLEARFATNRVFDAPIPVLHLDMLHPARRLWRARGAGCSLSSLEREVLGVERDMDVPGAMIPGLYFAALRSGDAGPLRPVFEHNIHDILSLAGLTAEALQLLSGAADDARCMEDVVSVARILETETAREAARLYRVAAEGEFRSVTTREETLARLGLLHRRLGDRDEAVRVFSTIATEGTMLRPFGLVEVAKHLEHVSREYGEAMRLAELALETLSSLDAMGRSPAAEFRVTREDIEHRISRLAARSSGSPWRRPP
ncbi:MAG: ribonuclease H-like domain-containing protein [Candidatus Eisenbacteria bacterium]|nr:ribonuclease H-like domain-containing protein [Candidatus Eisenbacteria bacterium]